MYRCLHPLKHASKHPCRQGRINMKHPSFYQSGQADPTLCFSNSNRPIDRNLCFIGAVESSKTSVPDFLICTIISETAKIYFRAKLRARISKANYALQSLYLGEYCEQIWSL